MSCTVFVLNIEFVLNIGTCLNIGDVLDTMLGVVSWVDFSLVEYAVSDTGADLNID
jgi:hypothetical protein